VSSIIVPPFPQSSPGITCEPWATTGDVCAPCDGLDSDLLERCLQAASDILFMLSGCQYPGECVDTIRPIPSQPALDMGRPIRAGWPYGYSVAWPGGAASGYGWPATAAGTCVPEQPLPSTPVVAVVYVKVDGEELDPALYRVDDRRLLVRLPDADGKRPGWPSWQDLALPATEPGTWEVQYRFGTRPPPAGVRAVAELGCQLALSCDAETAGECRLPERVQHITRQGLDAVVLDPLAFIDQGRTGLVECDYFLAGVNPERRQRPPAVWRPGMPSRARRTG
jgi:hypothetical protein